MGVPAHSGFYEQLEVYKQLKILEPVEISIQAEALHEMGIPESAGA